MKDYMEYFLIAAGTHLGVYIPTKTPEASSRVTRNGPTSAQEASKKAYKPQRAVPEELRRRSRSALKPGDAQKALWSRASRA